MHQRRTILKTGAAMGLVGVAGCAVPRADSAGGTDTPRYREWVPAAETGGEAESLGSTTVRYVDIPGAFERGERLSVGLAGSTFEFWAIGDWFGHELADIEGMVVYGVSPLTMAFHGDISTERAHRALEEAGYEDERVESSWTVLLRRDQPRVVGLTDTAVVQVDLPEASSDVIDAGRERIRAVLEAGTGERTRRHETDAGFERVTDALGRGIRTTVPLERPDWLPSGAEWGTTLDTSPDGTVRRALIAADSDLESPIDDEFRAHLAEVWGVTPTVETDGAITEATAQIDDDPVGDSAEAIPPRASLAFASDDGSVTVTHLAGEPLDLSRLSVAVAGIESEPLEIGEGTLEPGNSFTLGGVPSDVLVLFRYELESGFVTTIAEFVGSDVVAPEPEDELETDRES